VLLCAENQRSLRVSVPARAVEYLHGPAGLGASAWAGERWRGGSSGRDPWRGRAQSRGRRRRAVAGRAGPGGNDRDCQLGDRAPTGLAAPPPARQPGAGRRKSGGGDDGGGALVVATRSGPASRSRRAGIGTGLAAPPPARRPCPGRRKSGGGDDGGGAGRRPPAAVPQRRRSRARRH
jgi:hypothetical protein